MSNLAKLQFWRRGKTAGELRGKTVSALRLLLFASSMLLVLTSSAQIQSYTVTLTPGFTAIANHLNNGRNTLDEVFPSVPSGTALFKWNAAEQAYTQAAQYSHFFGWLIPEAAVGTLSPGEGALLRVSTQTSVTFRGTPQQSELRDDVVAGFNFVSCQTRQQCTFEEVFKFGPIPGDVVYKYNQTFSQLSPDPRQNASSVHRYLATGWDTVPTFDPGRSAFVYLTSRPRIIEHPVGRTVLAGTNVQLSVKAIGTSLTYQWWFRNQPLTGQTGRVVNFPSVALSNAGPYKVVVANSSGSVTSVVALLNVVSPPRVLQPPQTQVRVLGETAVFKVLAEGTLPLLYQWRFDGQPLPGQTNSMLTIPSVSPNHAGKYTVEIRNTLGTVLSPTATLTVLIPPMITFQPQSQQVNINGTAIFAVEATGSAPLKYQWLRNGVIMHGQTNTTLILNEVQPQDGASYRVVVANGAGAVQSQLAFLRVNMPFRPLADNFKDRELFREPSGLFRSSNVGATREPGEPLHAGKHGGKSIWMAWTSETFGIVTFRTRGSHIDTLMAAYVGQEIGALTEVASDEDDGGFFTSEISFNVTPNTFYAIAVDGYNGYEGEVVVEWFFEPTPERLPLIIEQPTDQVVRPGTQVQFSVRAEGENVRYRWFFNGQIIQGADGPVLTLTSARVEQAGQYYAEVTDGRRVVRSRMATLQFSLVGNSEPVLPILARDKFGDIVDRAQGLLGFAAGFAPPEAAMADGGAGGPVHGYTGSHVFSTVGAVKDEGEPDHCGIPGGASYWFSYIPPNSGQLFLNTDGSAYDTILAVYTSTGPAYSNLVSVACDNNSGTNGVTSSLNFPATVGVKYYIVIDGVAAVTGLVNLNYRLLLPLVISNTSMTNNLRFRLTGTPTVPFTIQRSADAATWTSVLTTNTATGIYQYLDTNSAVKNFYRALNTP